ncbi:MAG: 3-isopropylmalate dehydrogenase, partial [Lentisphaerae bacterium]
MTNTYLKAYEDIEFLNRDELRSIRLQTELLKPEIIMNEQNIRSTVCVFGSARTLSPMEALARLNEAKHALEQDPDNPECQKRLREAEIAVENSKDYATAREFAALMSQVGQK